MCFPGTCYARWKMYKKCPSLVNVWCYSQKNCGFKSRTSVELLNKHSGFFSTPWSVSRSCEVHKPLIFTPAVIRQKHIPTQIYAFFSRMDWNFKGSHFLTNVDNKGLFYHLLWLENICQGPAHTQLFSWSEIRMYSHRCPLALLNWPSGSYRNGGVYI